MRLDDFDYTLPEELIAQDPIEDRSSSRLLVYNRGTGEIEHRVFSDLIEYLMPGDCLVVNETKVFKARLYGNREGTGGKLEALLLRKTGAMDWEALAKPASRALPGRFFAFPGGYRAEVIKTLDEGIRLLRFTGPGEVEDLTREYGETPLPPYIHGSIRQLERYNTVYARAEGSAAAPTAGLHFTLGLIESIEAMGADFAKILLHVGIGTFRPVKEDVIENHHLHSESYEIPVKAAGLINSARESGHRVIAVGTTSVRALESSSTDDGVVLSAKGDTEIFIYPGYKFKAVDSLITNFHLPKSTLLMLVSAFMGKEEALRMYEEAIRMRYRFYSFGDACLII